MCSWTKLESHHIQIVWGYYSSEFVVNVQMFTSTWRLKFGLTPFPKLVDLYDCKFLQTDLINICLYSGQR